MPKSSTAILAACGEHYVAAYLSGFQLIVALPRAGVPGCDLLVANAKGGPAIRVQVKTGTDSRTNCRVEGPIYRWYTSFKVIDLNDKYLWYAYVCLNEWPKDDAQPEVFFVPAEVVVNTMKQCKALGDSEFFWMKADKAMEYKGEFGLKVMLAEVGQGP